MSITGWHLPEGSVCSVPECPDPAHESDPRRLVRDEGGMLRRVEESIGAAMSLRREIAREIIFAHVRGSVTGRRLGQARESADHIMGIFERHFRARMLAVDPTADVAAIWSLIFDEVAEEQP